LIESPQKRQELSTAAIRQAKQFSWEHVAKQYLACYQSIIAR
jgi:glycogen synthase